MTMILIREIDTLKHRMLRMSLDVEKRLDEALRALAERDPKLSRDIIARDDEIDRAEVEIEEECLKILALHQPVASDLRQVVAVLKINNDLERLADIAVNIAQRVERLAEVPPSGLEPHLQAMSSSAAAMLRMALDSLMQQDVTLARQAIEMDHHLDSLHQNTFERVTRRIKEGDMAVESLLLLLGISRDIERIGDHATNIAEDMIYMFAGAIVRHGHAPLPNATR